MNKILCFYHNADLDGLCSAAIVKKFVVGVDFYGINYGNEFPYDLCDKYNEIIMVDWTLQPFEKLLDFSNKHTLTVIDHHKSVVQEIDRYGGVINFMGFTITEKAACELCWEYFSIGGYEEIPKAVWLLGRYDVWDLEADPNVLNFQYGMRSAVEQYDDLYLQDLLNDKIDIQLVSETGKAIINYQEKQDKKYCELYAYPVEFQGYKCYACNKAQNNSQFFESLPEHDISISYAHMPHKNRKWTVSLYSKTIDTSVISKSFGGGGHSGASGFQCNKLPF